MQLGLQTKVKNATIGLGIVGMLAAAPLVSPACICDNDYNGAHGTPTPTGETHQYALENLPSHLADYFEDFGGLGNSEKIYINGVAYTLTNNEAAGVLSDMIPEDTIDKVISTEELKSMDNLTFLVKNNEISEGFNKQNFTSALTHLDYTPNIMNHSRVFETFNVKIRQEDLVLYEKLHQNPQDERIWLEIRIPNWDYHYDLWKDGESLLPLDKNSMQDLFPNKEDREMVHRGLWMPWSMAVYKPSTNWINPERDYEKNLTGNINYVIGNVKNMPVFNEQIMDSYDNPNSELHKGARFEWETQLYSMSLNPSFHNSLTKFLDVYDKILKESGDKRIDLARYVHGLMMYQYIEEDEAGLSIILSKSLGGVVFEERVPYFNNQTGGWGPGNHGEIMIPIDTKLKKNLQKYGTLILGYGQSFGWVPDEESAKMDGFPKVLQILPSQPQHKGTEIWTQN